MDTDDDHGRWAELAAGHVLSSLDDADEALYLEHAATCASCQELERELSGALANLARLPVPAVPPPSLKASIMQAVVADDEIHTAQVIPFAGRSSRRPKAVWLTVAAAAVAVIVGVSLAWGLGGRSATSIVDRCARVHCPTVALRAGGAQVATVMVLDQTAYVQTAGLPATPAGHSYVLWRISAGGAPVGVAAVRTTPTSDPVKAGELTVPIADIATFAVSEETGDAVPAGPTDVLAQGNTA